MQRFINNWETALIAPASLGATELSVPAEQAARLVGLGSGDYYELTLVEVAEGAEVAWEIVKVTGAAGGVLTVEREQDGTAPSAWPEGARISARLTAGLFTRMAQQLVDLDSRIALLEQGEPVPEGSNRLTVYGAEDVAQLGYFQLEVDGPYFGQLTPAVINWQGASDVEVYSIELMDNGTDPITLTISLLGAIAGEPESIDIEGIGQLSFADADSGSDTFPSTYTWWQWVIPSHDWSNGAKRLITVNLAP